jgi:hypothetical protein
MSFATRVPLGAETFIKTPMTSCLHYQCVLAEHACLRVSEEVVHADVERLAAHIAQVGHWTAPIPIEKGTGIIMDGNHRWHAARLLRLTHLPCIPIDYGDPRVRILRWDDGSEFPLADIHATLSIGRVLPYKSTRHLFAPPLPLLRCALDNLRRVPATAGSAAC